MASNNPHAKENAALNEIMRELKERANPRNVAGMAAFGINPAGTLGVNIPTLRTIARCHAGNHRLALQLWKTGVHEARLLAAFVDDPRLVTPRQMDSWAAGFDSWDVCDQACCSLFDQTPWAFEKAVEWSGRKEEFVKRAGFALAAGLAWHDKKTGDKEFEKLLPIIAREARDGRNFVKKAVNWALRNVGKRNAQLNNAAIATAKRIARQPFASARWIAADALRELQSNAVKERIAAKERRS
ncbi:MAG: DNA alkylation repair protein [Candidatus Micrarchaeota archaeon]